MATQLRSTGLSSKTHYARLGHAAQNLLPKFLQEVLFYYENPKNIFYNCNTHSQLIYRLKSSDWKKINEAVNTISYKNFDIPLIYMILRNIHYQTLVPTNGWDSDDPKPKQTRIGDDLERCRRRRNQIIHRGNTEVSDLELDEYFDEFKEIAGRLQVICSKRNNEFVSEVEDLRICCMDEDTERKYLEEIEEWRCRGLEYEDQISQLKEHLLAMGISEQQGNENAIFIKALKETTCVEGKTVVLQCIASGSKSIAEWVKNDEEILYDQKIRQECLSDIIDGIHVQVYKLVISESTDEDSGTYTIKLGNKTSSCVLSVTERIPRLIKLRNYQEELAEIAVTGQNTIICVGTNAGKTYVAYHIIEDHLIKYPGGKVVFINKTNVLLEQQYSRACKVFKDLNFQGKIYKWDASLEGECEPFPSIVRRVTLFFCTPKSLCNHLDEKSKNKIPMDLFTLIVLDECHHVVRRNPFNEIMNYYRRHKFESESSITPQVLGLTASPGTNRADDGFSAVQHLKCLMANMDVSKLSVVRKYEQELLDYSSTPTKVKIRSTERQHDPVEGILLKAIKNVESVFTNRKVTSFLMQDSLETRTLLSALESPPLDKRVTRYVQWISETKRKTESVMLKDADVPRLIHICLRHLELYVECLEMNSLLEIENVTELLTDAYGLFSYESQQASTIQEREIIEALKDVTTRLREIRYSVESNPDVNEIIKTLLQEYEILNDDSRFLVFVKTRASAKALAKRLPHCLKATHLTGGTKSKDKAGLHIDEQLEVMGRFREGEHLCIVATSVACEGLDIPQCNLMIRYKFRVDEISSYQMRGRIRDKGGREVILASSEDFERETKNILRQFYMKNAIEQVIDLDLTAHIAIAERGIYASEVQGRLLQQRQSDSKTIGAYTVNLSNWHDANQKCQLSTLHDVNNKKTSLQNGHAAWIQTTVLLSDWGYFLGCVPKSLNSKNISDIQKSLQRWFPGSKYPYNVKHIFECLIACTNRPIYQYFIYVRNICQCLNQSYVSWQPTTTCIGACEGTDIFCTSGRGLPLFRLYDSMTNTNTFDSRTTVPTGHQCYSTSEQPIRSCKDRMKFVCNTTSHNGTNSSWYESTHECFAHATTLIQFSPNITGSFLQGIWLKYFRNMQLIQKSDEVVYYDGSRRCLVAIRHEETVLIKIVYCSDYYDDALCTMENTDDIFKAISTTKENTYAVTVYENDFDKTSSSMISYTQTDSAVEHQNLTEIHIINIFLLGGLLLVLIAVLWRAYLKSRVRCYEHATELASTQRQTEQPDYTVDDLDDSETFEVHYSVINDSSYM